MKVQPPAIFASVSSWPSCSSPAASAGCFRSERLCAPIRPTDRNEEAGRYAHFAAQGRAGSVEPGQAALRQLQQAHERQRYRGLLNTPQFRKFLPQQFSEIEKLVAGQGSGNFASSIDQYLFAKPRLCGKQRRIPITRASSIGSPARPAPSIRSARRSTTRPRSASTHSRNCARRISSATDAKEVLDLSARLQAEQALLQNDVLRMQGLAMIQQARGDMDGQREREKQRQIVDEMKAALQ